MFDLNKEGILELFDFHNKSVLCCSIDKTHIVGLINRGAIVWFRDIDKERVTRLDIHSSFKKNINFITNNSTNNFDYSIVSDMQYNAFKKNEFFLVKEHIVLITGKINVIKWLMKFKCSFNKDNKILYSVVPSLNNIKLIIPEQLDVPFDRYWTFRCSNPFTFFRLIIEWFFIRNNLLRKIFSDKLIVFKC